MLRRIKKSSSSKYGRLVGVRESNSERNYEIIHHFNIKCPSKTSRIKDREAILRLAGKYKGHPIINELEFIRETGRQCD